jgi:hypothetical protein
MADLAVPRIFKNSKLYDKICKFFDKYRGMSGTYCKILVIFKNP